MKYLNKIATVFCAAALCVVTLSGCEGGELFNVNAPDWIADKVDSIAESKKTPITNILPDPAILGNEDNTTGFWEVFTDDFKAEPGMTYQLKFINYGGASNWNNFVLILRNANKDNEYAVLRADNWGWGTGYTGEESDAHFTKKMESTDRDWAAWLKGMNRSKCTVNISNYGNGMVDVKMTMLASNGFTYTQEYTGLRVDMNDLYFAFTIDNSHVEFVSEFTEEKEQQPVSMTLSGVPSKVLLGTDFEEAMLNVKAVVTFENGDTREVTAEELQIQAIPDFNTLGEKTLVAIYNKTWLGENCTTPVIATATFNVVDKMYTCVGEINNSSAFWGAHSTALKVAPGETFVSSFTNYTNGVANWNNFIVVLANQANTTEYGVFRADNWGWGTGWGGEQLATKCTPSGGQTNWATWLAAMNGAKVTTFVTNNGDGTADLRTVMLGSDGVTYYQDYIGINTVTDPNDFYFRFTVDGCHLEFDDVIGAENNSSAFWGDHSEAIKVPAGKTCTRRFKNFTNGVANWNNFIIVLANQDNSTEYGVLRADNWGWGTGWGGEQLATKCTPSGGQTDWATWLKAMDEAICTVSVTNNGNGTADVRCVMEGNDGVVYKQDYIGLNTVTNPDDLYFRFTVDGCHLIFE